MKIRANTDRPSSAMAPKSLKKFSRTLAAVVALALLPTWAAAQPTAPLNDTGQTQCYDAANTAVACNEATTGNTGVRPGQDARYGRDAAQARSALPAKTGDGAAGFDFTALDASGSATAPGSHACVRDNVTGLIWSTETLVRDWAAAIGAGSTYDRCGYTTNWRLPTRRELLVIVHYGASSEPYVDGTYFPNTQSSFYWTSDESLSDPGFAWMVSFNVGISGIINEAGAMYVRLVRSGQ